MFLIFLQIKQKTPTRSIHILMRAQFLYARTRGKNKHVNIFFKHREQVLQVSLSLENLCKGGMLGSVASTCYVFPLRGIIYQEEKKHKIPESTCSCMFIRQHTVFNWFVYYIENVCEVRTFLQNLILSIVISSIHITWLPYQTPGIFNQALVFMIDVEMFTSRTDILAFFFYNTSTKNWFGPIILYLRTFWRKWFL